MYRLLERSPASPREEQTPGKSNRQRAALKKGKPAGKSAIGAGDITTRPHATWEASDQRGHENATPKGVAFCAFRRLGAQTGVVYFPARQILPS